MIDFRMILASVSRIGPDKQIEYLARFEARNPPEYTQFNAAAG
jgi:hypothetical protein